jgi:hypothetical protein
LETGGQFSSPHSRHHQIKQDQVRAKLLGGSQRSFGTVLFPHYILACSFQAEFYQLGVTRLIIDDQNANWTGHDLSSTLRAASANLE